MKTIEELYKEINASEELKKAVSEIKDKEAMAEFLKQHDWIARQICVLKGYGQMMIPGVSSPGLGHSRP